METTARFNRLDTDGWHRVLVRFTIAILGNLPGERPANVAAMWRRVIDGNEPTEQEWRAAEASAARAAAEAAAWASERATEDAAAAWSRIARQLFAAIEAEVAA